MRSEAARSVEISGVLGSRILVGVDALSPGGAHATRPETSSRQVAPGWRTPCCPETKCTFVNDLARVNGRRRAARNPKGAPSRGSQLTSGPPTAASCRLGLCFPLSRILAGQERETLRSGSGGSALAESFLILLSAGWAACAQRHTGSSPAPQSRWGRAPAPSDAELQFPAFPTSRARGGSCLRVDACALRRLEPGVPHPREGNEGRLKHPKH